MNLPWLSNKMGINLWEVVDVAKSKPYGFQAFYLGPGLGGHCIPLDPYYLSWKALEFGFHTSMIESSMMVNDRMPEYCTERDLVIDTTAHTNVDYAFVQQHSRAIFDTKNALEEIKLRDNIELL